MQEQPSVHPEENYQIQMHPEEQIQQEVNQHHDQIQNNTTKNKFPGKRNPTKKSKGTALTKSTSKIDPTATNVPKGSTASAQQFRATTEPFIINSQSTFVSKSTRKISTKKTYRTTNRPIADTCSKIASTKQ